MKVTFAVFTSLLVSNRKMLLVARLLMLTADGDAGAGGATQDEL
jgi:hypothetical protein